MTNIIKYPNPKLASCLHLVEVRRSEMPTHELYAYLNKQLLFIKENLNINGKLSSDVYERLNIGVICAKELEHIDNEFCEVVYEMLEEVGPKIVWDFKT